MSVSMDREKKRLALIWFVGAGLLFCLVLLQSVRNVYGTQTEKAWAWLLPSVMPTLSLIVGVLVSDVGQGRVDIQVDPFVPMLAAISSCFTSSSFRPRFFSNPSRIDAVDVDEHVPPLASSGPRPGQRPDGGSFRQAEVRRQPPHRYKGRDRSSSLDDRLGHALTTGIKRRNRHQGRLCRSSLGHASAIGMTTSR